MPKNIVLASNNVGKLREFKDLLAAANINVLAQGDFHVPEIEETGLSFVENAILKARHASQLTQLPALADDSGLEVDFLHGAPGINSARFAGPQAKDDDNNARLLDLLKTTPDEQRTARFQCLLVYLRHPLDPTPLICQGTWEGRILTTPQGNNGFGYDPLFFVATHNCSSAELSPAEKNRLSHRGKAMSCLLKKLLPASS